MPGVAICEDLLRLGVGKSESPQVLEGSQGLAAIQPWPGQGAAMRSTTGAYGDFPDYYYDSGNLFGSYLLGKASAMSRDTRRN